MWICLVIISAVLLGLYDVCKKQSLKNNSVLMVLLCTTALSTAYLAPWFQTGNSSDYLRIALKAVLVACSWISGLAAMELVPLSTVSTLKASRPVFVLLFSILLFSERLNALQWVGSILAITAIFILSRASRKEGIVFSHSKGILYMVLCIITGVASALYDKHILGFMDPMFVQCWTNLFTTVILALALTTDYFIDRKGFRPFKADWVLPVTALLITLADFFYFKALSTEGSLLSVVSMVRRSSVLVPFIFGAALWHEKNIRGKSVALLIMLAGIALITWGTI
ncbi:MAG: DMT family transporter [Bacteroidales bacterium]|nr:DMT family transporter [Bacteroidales bacterium]